MPLLLASQEAISPAVAEEMRSKLIGARYERLQQRDVDYYSSHDLGLDGEVYTADFWHAPDLLDQIKPTLIQHVVPVMRRFGNGEMHFRVYKMTAGGHYRLHVDDAGDVGFIWYLSKGWKPDWGGLLMEDDGVTMPIFNNLVVRHARKPHFVSEVAKHAKEPRYTIVGFL